MQTKYIKLGTNEVFNDQYMLAVFHVDTYRDELLDAASEIAAESSTGSNINIGTSTRFSDSLNAIVYNIDREKKLVWIAFPWRIFDRGGNVQNIITYINGNILGMGNLSACKLLDVWFPSSMLDQYDGPSYTIDNMRQYLDLYDIPILGTIIKPKIGLTSSEYAEVCFDFWSGGGAFVKNDEPQANQDFCDYESMVKYVRQAMDEAEKVTGQTKVHSFNVSAADFDEMIERAELVKKTMKPGSYAFLVDGITAGWTAVQTIRRRYPEVFLHFHRAGHGAFTRLENPFGLTVPVLTKLARLAGASGIHTGTAGIGKMSGSVGEDIVAAKLALDIESDGHFFEQSWYKVNEKDDDVSRELFVNRFIDKDWIEKEKKAQNKVNYHLLDSVRSKHFIQDWRKMKKTCPIISGGLNPVLLAPFIDAMQDVDFITTMGAGVHSHPQGTRSGAKALVQACEAWQQKVSIEEYSKTHPELRVAIDFFGKK